MPAPIYIEGGCPEFAQPLCVIACNSTAVIAYAEIGAELENAVAYGRLQLLTNNGLSTGQISIQGFQVVSVVDAGIPVSDYPAYAADLVEYINEYLTP